MSVSFIVRVIQKFFFGFILLCTVPTFSQSNFQISDQGSIYKISPALWLNNSNSALSFTMDDSNPVHLKVSQILEEYGFRGSFFINPGMGNWKILGPNYAKMAHNGHEIGNHTWNHRKLSLIHDADSLIMEVCQPIEFINKITGKVPVTFVHPYNHNECSGDSVVYRYHLFSRISSFYSINNRIIKTISESTDISSIDSLIHKSVRQKKWLIIAGHGLDGVGWQPITSDFFNELCRRIVSITPKIWVATLSEVAAYDYLRREIATTINSFEKGIVIRIENIDLEKYSNVEQLPMTLILETPDNKKPTLSTHNISDIAIINGEKPFTYLLTFDLKKTDKIYIDIN